MIASIRDQQAEIAALCRQFHVSRLDVFGSAARGVDFDPARSDADFVVEFAVVPTLAGYFGFRDALAALLGRDVDLVSGAVENPYIRAAIEADRELVYAG